MAVIIGAGILGAAGIAGDALSAYGQSQTNDANAQQAALNRQFQGQWTQETQNWETEMSDTAMQRRVQDLNAAGLNPALAVGQGGASQPTLGAPSGAQAQMQNPMTSFSQLGSQMANAGLTAAQIANTEADTAKKVSDTPTPGNTGIDTTVDPATGITTVTVKPTLPGHELGDQALASARAATAMINANLNDPGGSISVGEAQNRLTNVLTQGKQVDLQTAQELQASLIKAQMANNKLDALTAQSGQRVMGAQAAGTNLGTWIEALRLIIGATKGH